MHELSVVQSLIKAVRKAMPARTRLVAVRLDVGELEHLDAGILEEAWRALTERTSCAGSSLAMHRVPARIRCRACRHEYEPEDVCVLFCPECGAARPEVLQGTGILLRSLEVEERAEEVGVGPWKSQ